MINWFRKEYYFLSNMYPCEIEYKGIIYKCAEAAFQAQKCKSINDMLLFSDMDGKRAKYAGGRHGIVVLNDDELKAWERKSYVVMEEVVRAKFDQHDDLKEKLLATNDEILIEGNTWNDNKYGIPIKREKERSGKFLKDNNGQYILKEEYIKGKNNFLGETLMKIRQELKNV